MVVIPPGELGVGVEIRGKIQAPASYGTRGYGAHSYGAGADISGIYQVRTRYNKRVQVKMKLYVPTNRQTEIQQAWRAVFSAAVAAWHVLTENQKEEYRVAAKTLAMTGFNLFISEYLKEHK